MTILKAIPLDVRNTFLLHREVREWFSGECTFCGWRGRYWETPDAAVDELRLHTERTDTGNDRHPAVPEGEPWNH